MLKLLVVVHLLNIVNKTFYRIFDCHTPALGFFLLIVRVTFSALLLRERIVTGGRCPASTGRHSILDLVRGIAQDACGVLAALKSFGAEVCGEIRCISPSVRQRKPRARS